METTELQRGKIYVYKKYPSVLKEGAYPNIVKQFEAIQRVKEHRGLTQFWHVGLRNRTIISLNGGHLQCQGLNSALAKKGHLSTP
ncbi:MAG: hypothetical protein NTW22_07810 [Proteobacteria bacterium]|nr:hypothetical protein [Pseudomonadota bacterium]